MTKEHLRCQKLRKALTIGKHAYHLRAPNKIRLQGAVQDTQCWGSRSHPSVGVWTSTYSSHPLLTNCLWPWAGSSCLSIKTKKYHKLNQQWLHYSYWYCQGYQHYLCYWYDQYYQQTTCVAFPVPLNNQRSHSVDICCLLTSGSKALSSREDFQRAKLPWLRSSLLVVWLS